MRGNWFDTQADIVDEAQGSKFPFYTFALETQAGVLPLPPSRELFS